MAKSFILSVVWSIVTFCAVQGQGQAPGDTLRTVFFTDIHVTPGTAQDSLFRAAVEEVNAGDCDLVIFGGDLTDMGSNYELPHIRKLMSKLQKPWFAIPGNHESTWSENACTLFRQLFGHDGRVTYRAKSYLFLGYACGPYMKMANGIIRAEDLAWIEREAAAARPGERIISLCHYPLNADLSNRTEITTLLKRLGVGVSLYGHYHRLDLRNFDGIAGIPGRSLMSRKDSCPGYTLVDFFADSVRVREKPLGKAPRTLFTVCQHDDPQILALPCDPLPAEADYKGRAELVLRDSASIYTGAACCKGILYYGTSQGALCAYDTRTKREIWRHTFSESLYTTPICVGKLVVAGAASGGIWAFDARTGREKWHVPTATPVVGDGITDGKTVYIDLGSGSMGKIDLHNGRVLWRFDYGRGHAQGRPTLADGKLVFGAWNRHLYCLDTRTGALCWTWNNGGKSRFQSPGHIVPRIARGRVFITAPDRATTCLDLHTGKQVWRDTSRSARESAGISNDGRQFYIKTMDGEIVSVDTSADTCRELWFTDIGWGYEYNSCPIFVRDGVLYAANRLGGIAAVREDSTLLWKAQCGNSGANDIRPADDGSLWVTFAEGTVLRIP